MAIAYNLCAASRSVAGCYGLRSCPGTVLLQSCAYLHVPPDVKLAYYLQESCMEGAGGLSVVPIACTRVREGGRGGHHAD